MRNRLPSWLLALALLVSAMPLPAQVQVSVRHLAPRYGIPPQILDDTLQLHQYLQSLPPDNHALTDTCVTLNARLTTLGIALQHDYPHRGDTLVIAADTIATDYNAYMRRIPQLSAIALRYAYRYIERQTFIADSIQKSSLNQLLDTIRRNHHRIVTTCDGVGVRDKKQQKQLKDIYYAYLSVYNRHDLTSHNNDTSRLLQLRHFSHFQDDLYNDLLAPANIPERIADFTNTLRQRCGRAHLDVLRSYQRSFRQSADPIDFSTITQYYDYIERQLSILEWQSAYLRTIDLREQMDSNSQRIVTLYGKHNRQATDTYKQIISTINTVPAFTSNEEAQAFTTALSEFVNVVQQCYLRDHDALLAISRHGDSIIRACSHRHSDIAKAYRNIAQGFNLTPAYRTPAQAEHFRHNILLMQTLQRQYDTILNYRQLIESRRDTIATNWSAHLTLYNGYQNIRKRYSAAPSFSTVAEGSQYIAMMQEHIALQQHCITAIQRQLIFQGLDNQVTDLTRAYRNIRKAYRTLKKHYFTVRSITNADELLLYDQQYILFEPMQRAFLAAAQDPDAPATDSRLKGVGDAYKIKLILGMTE